MAYCNTILREPFSHPVNGMLSEFLSLNKSLGVVSFFFLVVKLKKQAVGYTIGMFSSVKTSNSRFFGHMYTYITHKLTRLNTYVVTMLHIRAQGNNFGSSVRRLIILAVLHFQETTPTCIHVVYLPLTAIDEVLPL